ncbi:MULTISPECIES: tail fiber protein [Pelosinus]|uniref:Tail Collar domain protein n=1 Tax=Pelosinus fermentans B4 TaxID=1149862 RepID=I9LB20_9FIRM|nr:MULTISPECIES: tail fiber protein [Pelosinus]EIW17521.1 Tail Collar domain protein [Pelosinus fermentans B4]EIW23581.1 Tail Collar domain protein [Pelosinus fermentans A11]OAM92076.1 Tail Collar domain protein [Pelosinus fermentans DSM 17108]SDQ32696.1 Microcystin-dependent protein [Pelosinus fermentans]
MGRTINITDEIIVVSHGEEDTGKMAMLGANGKFHVSVIPEMPLVFPTGAIQYFALQLAPEGWLIADGSEVSREKYSRLFVSIGTTFGSGNGTNTFSLPDLRGEFIRGIDCGRGIDVDRQLGSMQSEELKSHAHNLKTFTSLPGNDVVLNDGDTVWSKSIEANPSPYNGVVANTYQTGGAETRPRNVALLACIKY